MMMSELTLTFNFIYTVGKMAVVLLDIIISLYSGIRVLNNYFNTTSDIILIT